MPLTEDQKTAMIFLKYHDGLCDWDEEGLTVEISESLAELCFIGYVGSYCETETWMLTDKGEDYVQ